MTVALLQLALSMSLVGANVIVGKLLAAALPVPVILLGRCVIGALLLAPFALRTDARPPRGENAGGEPRAGGGRYAGIQQFPARGLAAYRRPCKPG